MKRFIADVNFYDAKDTIIVATRAIQRGDEVSAGDVATAATADAVSHYGQALKMGYGCLRTASDFFTSDEGPESLRGQLDIGKPGRDGKSV